MTLPSNGDFLSAIVKPTKILFPKGCFNPGDFAIVLCSIEEVREGIPPLSPIIVKGNLYSLDLGKLYYMQGEYEMHPKYGGGYKAVSFTQNFEFSDRKQLNSFLRSIVPATRADAICSLPDPIKVLENEDTQTIASLKGMGEKTARKIITKYKLHVQQAKAYVALAEYELPPGLIESLLAKYDGNADKLIHVITKNPYILIHDAKGIGWKRADAIALKMGISKKDILRMKQGILFQLSQFADAGHTYVTPQVLVETTLTTLDLDGHSVDLFRNALLALHDSGEIWWDEDKTKIALTYLRKLEEDIAYELHRISQGVFEKSIPPSMTDEMLAKLEEEQGWAYTDEQASAIRSVLTNNVSIITGSAGVGKSTTVKGVLRLLNHCTFAQCALSGRAAARLSEVTGAPGSTIHRLLGLTEENHSPHMVIQDIVILDEVSMVGASIFYDLVRSIPTGKKLIMLGDPGQLESIGLCNIFKDMLDSGVLNVCHLTKIHRQAARSAIITESQKLRNCKPLISGGWIGTEIRGELRDLKLIAYEDSILSQDLLFNEYKGMVHSGISPQDIQMVLPMRTRGEISVHAMNMLLQNYVNPPRGQKEYQQKFEGGYTFRIGDRVLVTKNSYGADLENDPEQDTCDVFNGDCGVVESISDEYIRVSFPQYGTVRFPLQSTSNLELSYAMTCHKLQGSEAPYVIIGMDSSSRMLQTREWLYTAITRAKKYCVLVAQSSSLSYACSTSNVSEKKTMLKELLQQAFAG